MILTKSYYFLLTLPSVCETGQQKVTCSMSTIQTLEKAGDTFKVLTKTIYQWVNNFDKTVNRSAQS